MWLSAMTAPTLPSTCRTSCSFMVLPPFLQNCRDFFRDFLRRVHGRADFCRWLRNWSADNECRRTSPNCFGRSHNSLLVASGCQFGTNAGRDFQQAAELLLFSEKLEL